MDTYEDQNPQEHSMDGAAGYTSQQPWQPVYYNPYQQPMYPVQEQPKKSGGKVWKTLVAAALILALVVCSCAVTAASVNAYWRQQNSALSQSFSEKLTALRQEMEDQSYVGSGDSVSGTPNVTPDGSLTPAQVYAQNVKSVVAIDCTSSSGSGFVLTADGYIATNYHVVDGARSITITCSDGASYPAKKVGGDEANDIAVIKAEATGLQPAKIGRSDHLIVGDQVVAIGNPLGTLASTLTVGYVSAKDRLISIDGTSINMLQTDAVINPGNSGGPLFNMKGEVIGITTAKFSGTTESGATIEGIGFAIPMDDVVGMLDDLMEKGYISGAYLGVMVVDVTQATSQAYGIPLGALVTEVDAGFCAQKAGIRAQDVIVNVGGYEVNCLSDLSRALRKFEAGDSITVTVFRISAGGEVTVTLTLDEKPNTSQQTVVPSPGDTTSSRLPSSGNASDWFDYFFGR